MVENQMIYFIQGTQTKNIKIGVTTQPIKQRMADLMSSDRLVCLKTMEGSYGLEEELHFKFRKSHSHAEWFRATPDLLAFIESQPVTPWDGVEQTLKTSKIVGAWLKFMSWEEKQKTQPTARKLSSREMRRNKIPERLPNESIPELAKRLVRAA